MLLSDSTASRLGKNRVLNEPTGFEEIVILVIIVIILVVITIKNLSTEKLQPLGVDFLTGPVLKTNNSN